jgi:hypothetical protein
MKLLTCLSLTVLSGCAFFGLTEDQEKMLKQHRAGAGKYFDSRHYEKAIVQCRKGLLLAPDDYRLTGQLAWSHLQLSLRARPDNEVHLFKAQIAFADLIEFRDIEDHDPKNVFGYAIALNNWGRVEESRAERLRHDAKTLPKTERPQQLARATEHDRLEERKDVLAKIYFLHVAEGSFSQKANKRDAYKYLMAIEYRHGRVETAIKFGQTCLDLNAKNVDYWEKEYQRTEFPDRERIIRRELADLKNDELAVRSRLAAYHRERARQPKNATAKHDYTAAIAHLDKILAARINSSEDYYIRATCHRGLGERALARKDYKMFLSLGKRSREHVAVKDAEEYLYGKGK